MRNYLKYLRNSKAMSQIQIANLLDISESYYNLIENGQRQKNISMTLLTKLADVFGVPVSYLIAEETKLQSTAK